ncbi:unnamed protein product [Calicophoron daubneyi]|uniref:Uncharacterized protein n=1 Tax=Calicophoron daubneyi TaxID=300641 RepID=A0AAV2TRX1_CALDB
MFSDPEIAVDANDWIIRHLLRNSGITCVRFTDLTDTKDPKYSRVLRGVRSFMEAANEYLEGVEYTGNLLTTALLFMETEVRFTPEEEWKGGSGKKATENFIKRLIMGSAKVRQIRHNLFLQGANLIQHLKDDKSLLSKKNIKQQTAGNESSSENSSIADSVKSVNEVLSKLVTLVSREQNALSMLVTKKLCESAYERKQSEMESIVCQFKKAIFDQLVVETVRKCQEQLLKLIQSLPNRPKNPKPSFAFQTQYSDNCSD